MKTTPTPIERAAEAVSATTIEVSRDGRTGLNQLAIYRNDLGTRLAGPKFSGASTEVATFTVTPTMARELIAECQRVIDLTGGES